MFILGSHNSHSYDLRTEEEVSPACPPVVGSLCSLFGPMARSIVHSWSVCQSLSIVEQLEAGIRYFHLRITSKPQHSELFFEHGLYGGTVEQSVRDISDFLEKHPKEVALINFNTISAVSESGHQAFLAMLKVIFGSKLCAFSDVSSISLKSLWDSGFQVVVFYNDMDAVSEQPEFWPADFVRANWAQTESVETLMEFLDGKHSAGPPAGVFNITQAVLTPTIGFIMSHMNLNLKDAMARPVAEAFVAWLKANGSAGLNICMVDFVELGDFIETVIKFNYDTKV